jgi:arylsulfatase A-like enzyme
MESENKLAQGHISRRHLLRTSAGLAPVAVAGAAQSKPSSKDRPNILVIMADQVRWDAIGAYGRNPMNLTPNLDAMAHRGTLYRNMFTNQPVCSPSRSALFTGQYPARSGVWRNAGTGVGLPPGATTIATECRTAGYSANYIGKWHLADGPTGPVSPDRRGGFLNLWQAANMLELTSQPYEGDIWDTDGKPIHFANEFRANFLTGLAKRFLSAVSRTSPFLLVVSYLEPHQQNDLKRMVAPHGYAERFRNPFVPEDLRPFSGDWQQQLPDYYGCIRRIDECIGDIRESLVQNELDQNTIVAFVSDHGCHFMTRNTEYKRSGHDASLHVPLILDGPGFQTGLDVQRLVGMVDFAPTLLEAAGVPIPTSMQGKSTLALASGKPTDWRNEVFFQMSEYWVGRGLRTPQWTFVSVAPRGDDKFKPAPHAPAYSSFQLYDNEADPHQLVNLAGRKEVESVEPELRERLLSRMEEAGDAPAELRPCPFPYA